MTNEGLAQMMIAQKIKASSIFNLVLYVLLIAISAGGTLILLNENSGAAPAQAPPIIQLNLTTFTTTGLNNPVGITNAGPGDNRLFVIEQAGIIKIVQSDGTVLGTPFLDITGRVDSGGEEGLLGLTFHPDYDSNGYFYVNYTHSSQVSRISRFTVTTNINMADSTSEEILLTINQPATNHNAGDMHFGPDGYLYIPMGDGGGSANSDNGQDLGTLLGKIIRIDVDSGGSPAECEGSGTGNYTIPLTNPLRDGVGGNCDEIWAMGLRNPWRSSFDRLTGDFFIADVGQNDWEEIDFQPANSTGGENYGWDCYEASTEYNKMTNPLCSSVVTFTNPIFEYKHFQSGCTTVIGGYVYRGSQFPVMSGRYLLTDYCTGNFWDLAPNGGSWQVTTHTNLTAFGYVSFGEDANGELYVANISNDTIYRLEVNSPVLDEILFLPVIMKNS